MDGKCGDVNYDDVNMDMSDTDESDNEMFANKAEYDSFKQHFKTKAVKAVTSGGGGGGGGEYGGDADTSEYGGGCDKVSVVGSKFGHQAAAQESSEYGGTGSRGATMGSGEQKVDRKPLMYGDKNRKSTDRRSEERHDRRSKERQDRRRSGSREDRRRRSRSRDRDRRRSRSRSPNRGGRGHHHHHRGGRDHHHHHHRDRDQNRRREREEGARNHEEQMKKVREMGVELPKYLKPGAVNPLSYAEQMQKRKALFGRKPAPADSQASAAEAPEEKEAPAPAPAPAAAPAPGSANVKKSFNNWESTNFGNDKANEKFRRLMGIKSGGGAEAGCSEKPGPGSAFVPNHDKIMNDLDRNYEAARQQTHRNRGIGLGFADSGPSSYHQPPPAPGPGPEAGPPPGAPGNMFRNMGWQNRATGGISFVKKH